MEQADGAFLGGPLTMTRRQAAAYLGVSVPTLDRLAAAGAITPIRLGGQVLRYRAHDVERFVMEATGAVSGGGVA